MSDKRVKKIEMRHTAAFQSQVKAGLGDALKTENGRAMLWEILSMTGLFQNSHTGNALNSAFNAGRQSIGQDLMGLIEDTNPHAYITMMKESVDRAETLKVKLQEEMDDDPEND